MADLNFDKMGIYDLRNYARSIGVPSPTKLKRKELIASINAIIEGVEKPEKPKDNRGRPPKHQVDDMYMLDMFVPQNLFNQNYNQGFYGSNNIQRVFQFGNASALHQSDDKTQIDIAFDGLFVKRSDNYGLILKKGYQTDYFKENVIVLKETIEKFDLRNGDFVEGMCSYIKDKNLLLAKEIYRINDCFAKDESERKVYDQIQAKYPSKILDITLENRFIDAKIIQKLCPIAFGSRTVINNQNTNEYVDFCANMLYSIQQKCQKTYLISFDDSIEDISEIQSFCENVDVCKYTPTITREQFVEKMDLIFDNACRRFENGQDVVIILYNVQNLIENIKNYVSLKNNFDSDNALIYAQNRIKDIFGLARATENGSLTVIGFNANSDVLAVSNCQIEMKNKSYPNTDIYLDIAKSQTKNIQKLVDENEYRKYLNFKNNFDEQKNIEEQINNLFD